MKAGPKGRAELSPLPWRPRSTGADQLRLFGEKFLKVPKGLGARGPFRLRPWQVELARTLFEPAVSLAVWVLPRGNGKSGLAAAIALHHVFMSGIEGARCGIVAQDERSATRLLKTAIRMIELNEDLAERAVIYRDRVEIPGTDSVLVALPAEAHRVEGEDFSLVILDEIGFMPKATFEAAVLSTGKRGDGAGKVLAIGTPSPSKFREVSPLWDLVIRGRSEQSEDYRLVEYGADPKLPLDDPATWAAANPAYGDWLTDKAIRAQLPPVTRELEFRRARLGQWVETSSEPAFPPEAWRDCARDGVTIPAGSRVVLALDGSVNGDSTAVLVGSVSSTPHFQIGGLWEPSVEVGEVNHLEVEDRIRDLAERYRVVEIVADPFRWQRSLQVLDEDGLPVSQFPQTPRRLTPATSDVRAAVNGGLLTHANEPDLNKHVLRASLEETSRGMRLTKPSKKEKIDLAVCLVMAYSRCTWLASPKQRKARKVKGYRK